MFDTQLQVFKFARSCWRISQSFTDTIVRCNLVSSAYRRVLVCSWTTPGRLLINITKIRGPTMLPRGTPEVTGSRSEAIPSITALCDLSFRQSENPFYQLTCYTVPFQLFNKDGVIDRVESLGKVKVQNIRLFGYLRQTLQLFYNYS